MKIMSEEETSIELGRDQLASQLLSYWKAHQKTVSGYSVPTRSSVQTILARRLAGLLCREGGCWIQITNWNSGPNSNLDLFYGYRTGLGETRSLAEASVHYASPDEKDQAASIISMIFYFGWDAWIFDKQGTYLVDLSNDEIMEFTTDSDALRNALSSHLLDLGMSALDR